MTVFIPGKLVNPLNGSVGHWSKHARWAQQRRYKAEMCIFGAVGNRRDNAPSWPKRITFTAFVWSKFDDDNIRACVKPYRDACKTMRLIDDDRESSGHTFEYRQVVSRGKNAKRGVEIEVALK